MGYPEKKQMQMGCWGYGISPGVIEKIASGFSRGRKQHGIAMGW